VPNINIGVLNCRSLRNKTDFIHDHIVDNNIDIMAMTETWLSSNEAANTAYINTLTKGGFNFNHVARTDRKGGGVAVLTHSSLQVQRTQTYKSSSFESIELSISAISVNVRLVVIYRMPPSSRNKIKQSLFINEFTDLLERLSAENGKLIIVGDFNVNWLNKTNQERKQLNDILDSFGLIQHITEPTHQNGHLLDYIISRGTDELITNSSVSDLISDHHVLHASLTCGRAHPPVKEVTFRHYSNIDFASFIQDIEQSELASTTSNDIDRLVLLYNRSLESILDKHAPLKKKVFVERNMQPWMCPEILAVKRLKRKSEKVYRNSKLTVHFEIYKENCKCLGQSIKKAKSEYYLNKISACNGDQGKLFHIVESLLGRTKTTGLPTADSPSVLATTFNDFFATKILKIRNELTDLGATTTIYQCPPISSLMSPCTKKCNIFNPTTVSEMNEIVLSMNKTTCASDPFPSKLIPNVLTQLIPFFVRITNLSLSSGIFPSALKAAIIRPLLKKANLDLQVLSNYRPVSNLSFLSKVIEKVIAKRLFAHMSANNLFDKLQSAYKPGHSTETALLRIQNDILNTIDTGRGTLLVLLDLSAAFDTVDHSILLGLLEEHIGVSATALALLESYLSGRSQRVTVNNIFSEVAELVYGVPQGSILGPIKFCIYTLPLGAILRFHNIDYHIYADDTQLYLSFQASDPDSSLQKIITCISDIRSWMINSKLKINDSKSEFLIVTSPYMKSKLPDLKLSVGTSIVCPSQKAKNLGVIFDSSLDMNNQISNICKSAYFHIRNIGSIRNLLTHDAAAQLIHSLITSRFDYCNSLLYGLSECKINRLQKIQNTAARILMKSPRYCHITPVLKQLHWLPVRQRITFKILIITYRAFYGLAPSYICDLIVRLSSSRSLRSNDKCLLAIPKTKLKSYGDRAFNFAAAKEWNSLPLSIRQSKSLGIFKSSIKTFLFNQYFTNDT